MKLTNIHDRKNFIKINEGKGGAGADDGFANNLALKDTYLGALINGMFRGISWLWRKSKEFFVIDKLIAKVINELLRGVILYCFVNNIDLKTGNKFGGLSNTEEQSDGNESEKQDATIPIPEEKPFDVIEKYDTRIADIDFEKIPQDFKDEFEITEIPDPDTIDVYEPMEEKLHEFLLEHVKNWDTLDEVEKKTIRNIYVNYKLIHIINKKYNNKEEEEEEEVDDENKIEPQLNSVTYDDKDLNEAIVKPKMSNPQAGNVNMVKSVATKFGASITINDILTKRDKEKYKDSKDQFNVTINSINLAEIEKSVEQNKDQSKVSALVNPENMKTIQLTAQELFITTGEKQEVEKNKLKIKWNKELSKVYAGFTNIMNIHDVDIRVDFRTDLEGKARPLARENVDKYAHLKKTGSITTNLVENKVLDDKKINFSDLKDGKLGFLSFSIKGCRYIGSVTNIVQFTRDSGDGYLLKILNTFSNINFKDHKYESNFKDFKNEFALREDMDVFFLFDNPYKTKYNITMLLINVDIKINKVYILDFSDGPGNQGSIDIKDHDLEKIKEYKTDIQVDELKQFDITAVASSNDIKTIFKYDGIKTPSFYQTAQIDLLKIKDKLRKLKNKNS